MFYKSKIPKQELFMLLSQVSGKLFFFSEQNLTFSTIYFAVLVPIRHMIVLILLYACRFFLKPTQFADESWVQLNFILRLWIAWKINFKCFFFFRDKKIDNSMPLELVKKLNQVQTFKFIPFLRVFAFQFQHSVARYARDIASYATKIHQNL